MAHQTGLEPVTY